MHQEAAYGDRDGDGDVDATDKGSPGITCGGTVTGACRILDLDFDGDYDSADATLFDNLPQGLARHPGRVATAVDQPFGHQGLLHEPELAQYQNRHRQYDPTKRRFIQRDPLGLLPFGGAGYGDGTTLYGYVRNTPLFRNDPRGLGGPNPAYDWVCCDGLSMWYSDEWINVFGWTHCCEASFQPYVCTGHYCLRPDIVSRLPCWRSINCIVAHEMQHVTDFNCGRTPSTYCCERQTTMSYELIECRGYAAELWCLWYYTGLPPGGASPIMNDRCNWSACMMECLCPGGWNPQNFRAAKEFCGLVRSWGWPLRSGCSAPFNRDQVPPPWPLP